MWINELRKRWLGRPKGIGRKQPRHRFLPRLEALEDRTVLSIFTVTNLNDSGPGSLRAAVQAANAHPGPDVIQFAPGLHGTILLTSGWLHVTDSVAIDGPGARQLTVSGNHTFGVFAIFNVLSTGPTVAIAGLTIANGLNGIVNSGFLTLSHDVVSGNESTQGGGVFNDIGASLTINQCTFSNNQAMGSFDNSESGWGGGVFNLGTANVIASTFIGNQANGAQALPFTISGGLGGGIANVSATPGTSTFFATLTVDNCTFTGNQSLTGTAIDGSGGAIDSFQSSLTVRNSTFTGNRAFDYGGAIRSVSDSAFNVSNCTFANNQAKYYGVGGAIEFESETATVSNSTFTHNQALGTLDGAFAIGGAIADSFFGGYDDMTLTNCVLTDNEALGGPGAGFFNGFAWGGAIYSQGNLTILNSTLSGNRAIGGALGPMPPLVIFTTSFGGGLLFVGANLTVANSSIVGNQVIAGAGSAGGAGGAAIGGGLSLQGLTHTISNSLIADNETVGGAGGSGAVGGPGVGGGIDESFSTVSNCTVTHNQAIGGAGGLGASGGAGFGGGIEVGYDLYLFAFPGASSVIVDGSTIDHNTALGGNGGLGGSGGDGWGGGLLVLAGSAATISDGSLDHNAAIGGDGQDGGNGGNGFGGGLYVSSGTTLSGFTVSPGTATISNSRLDHNAAIGGDGQDGGNGFGGGVYIAQGATVSITRGTITHNLAQGGEGDDGGSDGLGIGGGVYNLGIFTFDPTTVIKHNHASTSNDDIFP